MGCTEKNMQLKVLSWNVAARNEKAATQSEAIARMAPDVLSLQEVTKTTLPVWQSLLPKIGLSHVTESLSLVLGDDADREVRYVQLTASRFPLTPVPVGKFEVPWKERVLTSILDLGGTELTIHNAYIPTGSGHGWIKIETLEGIYRALDNSNLERTILCGDFNTPQDEFSDGTVVTWAQKIGDDGTVRMPRSVRKGSAERWDAGERNVLQGLKGFGCLDAYRRLHGYDVREESWKPYRKSGAIGRRFDLIFATTDLEILAAGYAHEVRHENLSDHSAAYANLVV